MSTRSSRARDSFMTTMRRVSGATDAVPKGSTSPRVQLKALGTCLVASQLAGFADQLGMLVESVEAQVLSGSKASISSELVVPEAAFDLFGTLLIKASGAVTAGKGTKDKNLLDTYRIPIALDVAALADPQGFVSEMFAEIDAMYARGEQDLDRI